MLTKDDPVPSLFSDPAFLQSMQFKLSSSNVSPARDLLYGGFGPVTADGYGVNYAIGGESLRFSISTRRLTGQTCPRSFRKVMELCLFDVIDQLEKAAAAQVTVAEK